MGQGFFDFKPPVSGIEPIARHCSALGAQSAEERIGRQSLALLSAYRERGPLTDQEAAAALNVQRSTVNARRNELVRRGFVMSVGTRINKDSGIKNVTWGIRA